MDTLSGNRILGNTELTVCREKAGVKGKKMWIAVLYFQHSMPASVR